MIRDEHAFQEILQQAKAQGPIPMAVAHPCSRESMQVTIVANGSCLAATWSRRPGSWSGCSSRPAAQCRLPASSLAQACAGDNC